MHNSGYWQGREFIGCGPSAFSFLDGRRFSTVCDLQAYCERIERGESAVDYVSESVDLNEMVAVGLRMNEGVDLGALERHWGEAQSALLNTISQLESLQLLEKKGSLLRLTSKGRMLYDSVATEII